MLLFQLTGLEMFYVEISFQPMRAAHHCTHSVYLHCLPDGFCLHSLSSYCVPLPENKHPLTSLGICIVYIIRRSRVHLIEAELKTQAQVKAGESGCRVIVKSQVWSSLQQMLSWEMGWLKQQMAMRFSKENDLCRRKSWLFQRMCLTY